jgi:hypothetical protein
MKKSTTFITSLLLASLMSVSSLSYGLPVEAASAPENKPTNAAKLVNDYENQKDLNSMMMYSVLGDVTINEEDEFVSHGNASAKITVMADPFDDVWDHVNPSLYQAMKIKKDGRDYTDFSSTGTIEFDVYNTSEEEQKIGLALRYSYYDGNSTTEWFTLAPSAWTTVRYTVVRETIPTSQKDGVTIRKVEGAYFYFERPDEERLFYLDAVRIYPTSEPIGESVKGDLKEHEIVSFDSFWQIAKVKVTSGAAKPMLTHSREFTTDGGSSLKISMPASTAIGYYYIDFLKNTYFKEKKFTSYTDDDFLCFDVYSPSENGFSGALHVYIFAACKGGYFCEIPYTIAKGSMLNARIPVSEINKGIYADPENDVCFQQFTGIQFGYRSSTKAEVLYIDNIRVEKA